MMLSFRNLFRSEKKLILVQILAANQLILSELRAIHGESRNKEVSIQLAVAQMSGEVAKLTKMIYDMVESLSKYFKIEVEFMEKEKEKMAKKPTDHDAIY